MRHAPDEMVLGERTGARPTHPRLDCWIEILDRRLSTSGWRAAFGLVALFIPILGGCQCGSASECQTPPRGTGVEREVCIPGGAFTMGHFKLPPAEAPGGLFVQMPQNDWGPPRDIKLRPFYIDRYEVTFERYARCVAAGVCRTNGVGVLASTRAALSDARFAKFPVSGIRYDEARIFCLWDGKRLPTEAEWERVARGTSGTDYPWGNQRPSAALLSAATYYPLKAGDPATYPKAVGSYADDVSPDGVYDLFGSVPEWVEDWYAPLYAPGPAENPGAAAHPVQLVEHHEYGNRNFSGAFGGRVVRGDAKSFAGGADWDRSKAGAPVWFRNQRDPGLGAGIRCARDDKRPDEAPAGGFWPYDNVEWRLIEPRHHK